MLIALAVTLSALRFWLLPRIDQLRQRLENSLSQHLEQPIQIQHLKASLDGITPELRLIGVTVGQSGDEQLLLKEIQLGLDLPASLQTGQLQPAWIRILGAHIEVRRTADGRFHLLGLDHGREESVPRWLLADGRFELIDSTVVWHPGSSNRPYTWHNLYLRLDNRGTQHRLLARFKAPDVLAKQVSLSARLQGNPNTPLAQWQADFLLRLEQLQPAAFAQTFLPRSASRLGIYPSGQGTLQLWGTWRPDRLEGTADLNLQHLNWQPPWLAQPLKLHQASGRIHGRWDRNGWQIKTPSLHLGNADFEVYARLQINHPAQDSTQLEAMAYLARLNLANLDTYLPRALPAGLAKWSARKPLHGIAQGRLVWRGRLQDFPFRDHSGVSEAWFTSQQAKIEFHPRWPALTDADLNLKFRNGQVTMEMTRGKLGTAPLEALSATLDISASEPILDIRGRSRNPVKEILQVLKLSPLKPAITPLTTMTYLDGQATVSLGISLPIQRPAAYQIDGQAKLQGNWHLLNLPLGLDELSGELRFTQQRLTARLNGRFRQEPAHLEATVNQHHTRLTLSTQLDAGILPSEAFRQYLTGTTNALLTLEIRHVRKLPPRLSLYSDLQSLAVHLPYPLGKAADQLRPLALTAWLQSPQVPLNIDYGPLHAMLAIDRVTHQASGRIGLNQPPPPGNTAGGLILIGHLDRLPLDSWLALLARRRLDPTRMIGRLRQLELRADHLQWGRQDHGPHHLKAYRLDTGWQGTLAAPYTAGNWSWDAGQNQLDFELDFVALDELKHSVQDTGQTQALPELLALDSWPALTLHARHLQWQAQDLGMLNLRALPQLPARLNFDLSLVGDKHRLEASGLWHPKLPSTQVSGRFRSDDLGGFLKHIGHSTALVQTPTTIDFKLNWPGAPYQFSVAKLGGRMHLDMGPGRWLDAEPGAGRLLGLLYLGTLGRRLRLDFSDLFQAGLAYEHIGGHIRLKDGLALTDDLAIAAVSARIHIAGTVDLVNHQVDEYVTVFPNTPVTLGLFREHKTNGLGKMANLAQRLFNAPLDSITQSQYAISGIWDDPNIVLLRRSLPGTMLHGLWSELRGLTGNPDE